MKRVDALKVLVWLVVLSGAVGLASTTWTVTTAEDNLTGTCNDTTKECDTLRAALENTDGVGTDLIQSGDTITFAASLAGQTITLTSDLPESTVASLTIDASALTDKVTIQGNGNFRIFYHSGSGTFAIDNLNLLGGTGVVRGGFTFGGGLLSEGDVTVTNSTISFNTANFGGGIYSRGDVTITNSTILGNTARFGGGIFSVGTFTITNSTISRNTALSDGGGIHSGGGGVITNSTISENTALSDGGGIYSGGGNVTLSCVTLEENEPSQWDVRNKVSDGVGTLENLRREYYFGSDCPVPQFITFDINLADRPYGVPPVTLTASASSGLPVTLSSATPDVCTVTGTQVTSVATGTCTINADQAGGELFGNIYAAAPQVQQSFTIFPAELTVTANDVIITEGDTPTFTATIEGFKNGDTDAVLTNPVSFDDGGCDYSTAGTCTITPSGAAADNYTFTYATGTLTIQSAGFDITESDGNTTVTEGGAADTIEVVLTSIPTANVEVTVTPDGQLDVGNGAGADTTLTFTAANWNTPQVINVTANDDTDVEGNHDGTLSFAVTSTDTNYNGAVLADITVSITDNDADVIVTPTILTAAEGGAPTSYDLSFSTTPASDVTITITPDVQTDVGAGAGTAITVTFTTANATTAQTVTVTSVDDTDAEGNHSSTITHAITTGDGGDYTAALTIDDVTVAISDNDSAGTIINPDPDMQIRNGSTTAADSITSGSVVNVGAFKRGEVVTVDFLVRNPGAKTLELGELSLPSFLSNVGEPLPESLESFESALLSLEVNTSAAGVLEGEFSLASNDPDDFENPFVFTVKASVSKTPANVLNILPGVDLGSISPVTGQEDVVLLSFKLQVPAGSVAVSVDSLTLAASNAGIGRASNLRLYIDGGTRGALDNNDVFLSATDDTEALTFSFPTRTFSPNVPMWFIVVGDF